MSFHIYFRDSSAPFQSAQRREQWIDTSFAQSERAIGHLRLPVPDNGRYESKHPILDSHGEIIGHLVDGQSSLGYTFTCVYAGDCFWITHQGFAAVVRSLDISNVSIVDSIGTFLFSNKGTKYAVVKSFGFGGGWVDNIKAFKLLDEGRFLLYVTNYGICMFNTHTREIVTKIDLTALVYQWSGFAMSPKVKLIALAASERSHAPDPLDGQYRFRNFLRIYSLESGQAVGEQPLPGTTDTHWIVDFGEDGRSIRAVSKGAAFAFELSTTQ